MKYITSASTNMYFCELVHAYACIFHVICFSYHSLNLISTFFTVHVKTMMCENDQCMEKRDFSCVHKQKYHIEINQLYKYL